MRSLPRPVSIPSAAAQALPPSHEPRQDRNFNLFSGGLTIAGCGLLVLAAGTLVMRHELGYQRRQLAAEYEAKKCELAAEYEAKKQQNDAQTRQAIAEFKRKEEQLVAEYDRKLAGVPELKSTVASLKKREAELRQRELSGLDKDGREGRKRLKEMCDRFKRDGLGLIWKDPLIGEPLVDEPDDYAFDRFEYYLRNRRADEEEVRAYFELSYSARFARGVLSRREATHGSNDQSADRNQSASIFGPVRSFNALSPNDLHETERLGHNWRDKVDWKSPAEVLGSQPERVEADGYQYFVDRHPITSAEAKEYLALPWYKRMVICTLSRRQLLTARDAAVADR